MYVALCNRWRKGEQSSVSWLLPGKGAGGKGHPGEKDRGQCWPIWGASQVKINPLQLNKVSQPEKSKWNLSWKTLENCPLHAECVKCYITGTQYLI